MEQPAARSCTVCGTSLSRNDLFCKGCGAQMIPPPTTPEANKVGPQKENRAPSREASPALERPTNEQIPEKKLPSEAYRLASAFNLGIPKARYASISLAGAALGGLLIWIVLAVLSTIGTASAGNWWLGSLIALPIPVFFFVYTAFRRKYRVYICTDGFIYCSGDDLTMLHWDEVTSVRRSEEIVRSSSPATRDTPSSSSSRIRYLCSIQGSGSMISLSSDNLGKAQELYTIIAQEVERHNQ